MSAEKGADFQAGRPESRFRGGLPANRPNRGPTGKFVTPPRSSGNLEIPISGLLGQVIVRGLRLRNAAFFDVAVGRFMGGFYRKRGPKFGGLGGPTGAEVSVGSADKEADFALPGGLAIP